MNIVIPIAGRGSRFLKESHRNPEYSKPKPTINIAGHLMVEWAVSSLPLKKEDKLIFLVLKEHIDNSQIDETLKRTFGDNVIMVVVDKITDGAACTALLAKEHINNDEPLIITDSDHFIDGKALFKEIEKHKDNIDGMIPVFYANGPKWSYSSTDDEGFVIEVAEKVQISRNANIGAYYFAKGKYFVWAAEEMIEEDDKVNNEFYVAPVYNYMIRRGKRVRLARPKFVHGLGTPKDLEKFIEYLKLGEIKHNFGYIQSENSQEVQSIRYTAESNQEN